MLVEAFPQYADFFATTSYRGSIPEYRLFGRTADGKLVAHIEYGPRQIKVAGHDVRILGIGAVVHPDMQGRGVGNEMFASLREFAICDALADFGFLQCREAVAGFYERARFPVHQPCTNMHHETRLWETSHGPVMVMPLTKPLSA